MVTQVQTELHADASITPQQLAQPLTRGTLQNSTSGTGIDFANTVDEIKAVLP